jgi:hypothetical protein
MEQYLHCCGGPRGGKWLNRSASATGDAFCTDGLERDGRGWSCVMSNSNSDCRRYLGDKIDNMGIVGLRLADCSKNFSFSRDIDVERGTKCRDRGEKPAAS